MANGSILRPGFQPDEASDIFPEVLLVVLLCVLGPDLCQFGSVKPQLFPLTSDQISVCHLVIHYGDHSRSSRSDKLLGKWLVVGQIERVEMESFIESFFCKNTTREILVLNYFVFVVV